MELAGGGHGPPPEILAVVVDEGSGPPLGFVVLRAEELAGGCIGPPFLTAAAQIWTLYGDSRAGDAIAGEAEQCENVLKDN